MSTPLFHTHLSLTEINNTKRRGAEESKQISQNKYKKKKKKYMKKLKKMKLTAPPTLTHTYEKVVIRLT